MFYLKEWWMSFRELRVKGVIFLVCSLFLAFSLNFRPTFEKQLESLSAQGLIRPYFTAMFDQSITMGEVLAKLRSFPQVTAIERIEAQDVQKSLFNLMKSVGEDYQVAQEDIPSQGVRVILQAKLSKAMAATIKENLEDAVGTEHLSTSDIRYPVVTSFISSHPIFNYLKRYKAWGLIVPVALVWIFAFFACYKVWNRRAYLIQRFSRREYVLPKMLAMVFGVIIGLSLTVAAMVQGIDWMGSALSLMLFSILWTFSMREVVWKNT